MHIAAYYLSAFKGSPTVGFFVSRRPASFLRRCALIPRSSALFSRTCALILRSVALFSRAVAPFRICSTAQLFRVAALVRRFSVAALAAFRVTLVLSRRKAKCLNRRGKGEAFKP